MAESGWEKVEEGRDSGGVQEEELRHIFNIIDKDNSGFLNKSVKYAINKMIQITDEINFRRLVKPVS